MSLTNTEQCLGARTGKTSREGSRDIHRGDHTTMVGTQTRTPEEVDRAEEPPTAVAMAIAVTVGGTTWLQNIHLKEEWKTVRFPN